MNSKIEIEWEKFVRNIEWSYLQLLWSFKQSFDFSCCYNKIKLIKIN